MGIGACVTTVGSAAGWLEAGVCDGVTVAPAAAGPSAVGLVGGGFGLTATMITMMPTTAVTMPRRRTDQSGRSQSRAMPTGKKKISKSTMDTVRRYQGCVACAWDAAERYGEMMNSSSAIHSGQPGGGCGQDRSGSQSGGGDQPRGGWGQFGGGLYFMNVPSASDGDLAGTAKPSSRADVDALCVNALYMVIVIGTVQQVER